MTRRFHIHRREVAALLFAAALPAAHAQDWPAKPITVIVPSTAGGGIDTYARIVTEHMAKALKQQLLVDNRPAGGGGLIGAEAAARAAPDGYTLFVGTAAIMTINPSTYKKLPYAQSDFVYLCKGVEYPLVLVAHESVGVKDIAGLTAWLKANPQKANYASYQPGTPSHFLGHQLGEKLGLPLTHIPYRGSTPQVTDLVGGVVPFGFAQVQTSLPHIRSGRLVALATTGSKRADQLKDVPTLAEQGLGEMTTTAWAGLLAPKGTPPAIVDKLIAVHKAAVTDADVKSRLAAQGFEASTTCGKAFEDEVAQETARWAKVVKATGFTAKD